MKPVEAVAVRPTATSLSNYDPELGLKQIAVAEAAEKHYARAKNATKLREAIGAKLTAQCEFVRWWDAQEKKFGARGVGKKVASPIGDATLVAGVDGLPDRSTLSRWRQRLHPKAFEATAEKTFRRVVKFVEFTASADSVAGQNMAESNEWYTPGRYIEAARRVMGAIDLDPASCATANDTVHAARFYTGDVNGLSQPWAGRVWLNPPYSGQATAFIERLAQEFQAGQVSQAVVLVNSHGTDTQWFQPLWDGLLCFTDHRINFISPQGGGEESGSNHGSVFAYLGSRRVDFVNEFSVFGTVVERVRP